MPVVYQVMGSGRGNGRATRSSQAECSVISEGCMHVCQKQTMTGSGLTYTFFTVARVTSGVCRGFTGSLLQV